MEFDFIVIGAGSAGSAVANRLSADPSHRVALLEAGPPSHFMSRIPISFATLIDEPSANWCYRSEPEEATGSRPLPVPRGRLLGGSSSINGMVYVRGQQLDFDTWAQLGNRGWSYADVLPLFQRMEDYAGGGPTRRQGGPLRISIPADENPLYEVLLGAGRELGLPDNPDYNDAEQEGIVRTQATISNGRRQSTAHAYLDPVRDRKNLSIITGAEAKCLLLDGTRCRGVEVIVNGRQQTMTATQEVIVSGGAINSPKLLELSGIGRPDILEAHGIEVQHVLNGVGENLRDHIGPRMVFRLNRADAGFSQQGHGLGLIGQVAKYAFGRSGLLSLPTAPIIGFIKTRPELASPDIQYHFVPYRVVLKNGKRGMGKDPAITITVNQCRPESQGSVHINSADTKHAPNIRFNFLAHEVDRRTLIDGMRYVRRLMGTTAMSKLIGEELQPGADAVSDEHIMQFIRDKAETLYHPVGTCKMGQDPMAVVDPQLRVHGIDCLRIADASVMPTLTSGNTNAPCIMIGEKCADMVLAA
jgi:choline dehydrogenase